MCIRDREPVDDSEYEHRGAERGVEAERASPGPVIAPGDHDEGRHGEQESLDDGVRREARGRHDAERPEPPGDGVQGTRQAVAYPARLYGGDAGAHSRPRIRPTIAACDAVS